MNENDASIMFLIKLLTDKMNKSLVTGTAFDSIILNDAISKIMNVQVSLETSMKKE